MKWLILSACAVAAGLVFYLPRDKPAKGSVRPVAVLELFTSEGCSSCPAADRLLPKLANDSGVIALSFHVDYWDRLGWKDRFSSPAYTARQRRYAGQMKLESIYTPQLVINGRYEVVGSNEGAARQLIRKALNDEPSVTIHIEDVKREAGRLSVRCRLEGAVGDSRLLAALVQAHEETQVGAGENSGARLEHTNVVKVLTEQKAAAVMDVNIDLPKSGQAEGQRLILFTQSVKDLHITGAAEWKGQ